MSGSLIQVEDKDIQPLGPGMVVSEQDMESAIEGTDPKVVERAFETYLDSDLTLRELATDTGIPYTKLALIAKKFSWISRKADLHAELFGLAEVRYKKFVADNKVVTAERHLEVAKTIESKIKELADKIDTSEKSADIKLSRVAKSMSDISAVSARAVDMENNPGDEDGDGPRGKQGRVPLVVLGIKAERVTVSQEDTEPSREHRVHNI